MSVIPNWPQRQIHLDFHTSPYIPDVASDFDAEEFAQTLKRAHVNSVTVFAKCHHGMCYYPTKTGTQHPALGGRDLLGEQIEALHRAGIRAPIYTTIVWEEDAAQKHPEWRQMRKDGTFAGTAMATDNSGPHPGAWKWLNYIHPEYQDYFEAHLREVCERYGKEVDGFFMDILMMHSSADWSEHGLAFRKEHNLLEESDETSQRFESVTQKVFCEKFTRILKDIAPQATWFYNSSAHVYNDEKWGVRSRLGEYTHYEVESLPSGFWGYDHFPRAARLVSNWKDNKGEPISWLAMTGRFQRQWGDFGGIKPQPALEYECFRAQALGGANSVGDQLPPRGILDPAAYDLIGAVFSQCEAAEPFYENSQPSPQVGIICPNHPSQEETPTNKSEEAAVRMCEEAHYDCAVLDDSAELSAYQLVMLPDSVVINETWRSKLSEYSKAGGKLLISHNSGHDEGGNWALDFLPLKFAGAGEKYPTYWRARADFAPELANSDRVHYAQGLNVEFNNSDDVQVLIDRVLPYFQRTDVKFSSHFQTPPVKEADKFPAVVAGENWVYFADPIFREYRQTGNVAARDVWKKCVERLIGKTQIGDGLPTTVGVYPRRRNNDLILTLLHYIPVRKALDIDVIEERMTFAGEALRLPENVKTVRVFGGEELKQNSDGAWQLPMTKGRLLLEVPGYFAS